LILSRNLYIFFHHLVWFTIEGCLQSRSVYIVLSTSYRKGMHTPSFSLATICRPNSLFIFTSASRAHYITGGILTNRRQLWWSIITRVAKNAKRARIWRYLKRLRWPMFKCVLQSTAACIF